MGFLVKSEKIKGPNEKKKSSRLGANYSRSNDTPSEDLEVARSHSFSRNHSSRVLNVTKPSSRQSNLKPGFLPIKHKIRAARKKGFKGDVYDLQYLVEEGPLSFRSFGFFGGFFMILASALDFVETEGDSYHRLVSFNLWLIGFITIQVEARPFHLQIPVLYDMICLFFSFLRYVWGRGFLYFVAGCFQFFLFSKYNVISGVYFMILGAFSIVFGYRASVRLAGLRNTIGNRDEIKFMFHSFDRDRDGFLSMSEFREMLMAMDQDLDHNDFVAAVSAIDMDNNQMVSYEELEAWWESYHESDLPPGAAYVTRAFTPGSQASGTHLMS